jgi:hypothetical protein
MFLALEAPPPAAVVVDKIVLFTGFYITIMVIGWQFFRFLRTRAEVLRAHAESRNRLLGMVRSLEELLAFARTPEGRGLVEPPAFPSEAPNGLHLIQAGVTVLGIAAGVGIAGGREGVSHALLVAFVGVGLVAGGYVGRYLRARWLRDTEA